ncbi:hypothetical protein ACP4OV_002775 [Aristida adscensionis]
MDVYISEEYVAQRRAERRAARNAAAARGGCEETKARAAGGDGEQRRWTAAWAEKGKKRAGESDAASVSAAGRVEDVILSYLSA